jgi:hypothetical protein
MQFDTRIYAYGSAAIGLLGALGCFIAPGWAVFGGVLAAFGAVMSLAFYKYGYILVPLITQQAKVIQITDTGYEIPAAQDVILKNVHGVYYASMFLGVKIYESTTDKSPEENVVYTQYFERAISSVKFVTKVAMLVYVKDLSEFRTKIETKHAEAQLRLARERDKPEADVLKLDRYEREVAMWENQINKLTLGIKPMGSVTYVMTTATGVSKEAATAAVKSQANELRATISNALNVEVVPLTGEEMMKCFDWEHMIPPTQQEVEQNM